MKRLLLSLLALVFSTSAIAAGKSSLSAVTTNPSAGAILCTTGSLSSGLAGGTANYLFGMLVSSTAAETFDLQALSGGVAVSHTYVMVAANTSQMVSLEIPFAVPDGITLNLVAVNSVLGTVQANLYWELASGT